LRKIVDPFGRLNARKAIKKPLPVGQQATVYAKDGEHTWSI